MKPKNTRKTILLLSLATAATSLAAQPIVKVDTASEFSSLLRSQDTDRDKKITILDKGSRVHALHDLSGKEYEVRGTYPLSNLLQELKLATDAEKKTTELTVARIYENPVIRISRSIREIYWDGLTRQIDQDHLRQILADAKIRADRFNHLYVPHGDEEAFRYFTDAAKAHPALRIKVWRLPEKITPEYVAGLKERHGLLTLGLRKNASGKLEGVPFVVPGGRFNEMYGWDSYFESLGLIADGRLDLAQAMVDNFVYEIDHYGKILNANRTYYLTRSQPPFLTSMIQAVWAKLAKTGENRKWLARSLHAAMREYQNVWMNPDHLTETGLSRYFGQGKGIPPEVEPGHFDAILEPYAKRHRMPLREFQKAYDEGTIADPELDQFFIQDRAVRESGHDTTYRWRVNGKDRCADFLTVDLNSLLYKIELDLARLIDDEFGGKLDSSTSNEWRDRAKKRKALILKYLWDPSSKLFYDYDFVTRTRSSYVSATTLYPLWAFDRSDPETRILGASDARALISRALAELELPGGIAATSEKSLKSFGDPKHPRQWDYPNGWAPHQILAWDGIRANGEAPTADRLIYKWLYTITRNAADFNGTIPEKLDVLKRSHAVFAEYGNVGTHFSYITKEGFGWMNASYQVGLKALDPKWRLSLEQLIPPEWLGIGEN